MDWGAYITGMVIGVLLFVLIMTVCSGINVLWLKRKKRVINEQIMQNKIDLIYEDMKTIHTQLTFLTRCKSYHDLGGNEKVAVLDVKRENEE